ncbi:hypothetical protein F4805DRAFT_460796 [Annulohypoxylon moriforme]|nr:hypothetical protein F4805DRAFT_460796 [Annulohypoxylon moriforme]
MQPKGAESSPNLEDGPGVIIDVDEKTPSTESSSPSKQTEGHAPPSPRPSLQIILQSEPRPQPYPYPQPESHDGSSYTRAVRHFCPVTLIMTTGPFCLHCRSQHYSLDESPSPPPVPPSSPSLSPIQSGASPTHLDLDINTKRVSAEADDLERRVLQLTEIIRRLTRQRDVLERRVSDLERSVRVIREFGLYARWPDSPEREREPVLDNISWEDVDRETELEAGSIISSQDGNESDPEVARIDPEWFTL